MLKSISELTNNNFHYPKKVINCWNSNNSNRETISKKILQQYRKIKESELENEKYFSSNFNVFDFFAVGETKHSELLGFLLDSNQTHGQSNLFLLDFLTMLNIESPEAGKWQITCEYDRIDIMLKREYPLSIIIIENKSNFAEDQPNQLYRYWYNQIYHNNPAIDYDSEKSKQNFKIIYLAPNPTKKYIDDSISKPKHFHENLPQIIPMEIIQLTFENDINIMIENSITKIDSNNYKLIEYLKQYQKLIKTL
jgi:PD-(D/E)XK nuclease superfamily